ncbi:MAG: hypothetical protein A2X32_01320 [Elusimicrobia bacterium GWC2_64_44]|nr:MAG: hypothetical protein A2X32_01320 [Elusimicrobia bacterium GWC2_64_44]
MRLAGMLLMHRLRHTGLGRLLLMAAAGLYRKAGFLQFGRHGLYAGGLGCADRGEDGCCK